MINGAIYLIASYDFL